jgi:N-glycosylase/DNA lyase
MKAIARILADRGPQWIASLRDLPYRAARDELDALPGYGPKVADCVSLFALGFDEAVPVDVHVWAIAHELFGEAIRTRTLTPKTYDAIGDRFRSIFGPWAGWAQQYLFCARRATPIHLRFRPSRVMSDE